MVIIDNGIPLMNVSQQFLTAEIARLSQSGRQSFHKPACRQAGSAKII
jgi:hypothetical protein